MSNACASDAHQHMGISLHLTHTSQAKPSSTYYTLHTTHPATKRKKERKKEGKRENERGWTNTASEREREEEREELV